MNKSLLEKLFGLLLAASIVLTGCGGQPTEAEGTVPTEVATDEVSATEPIDEIVIVDAEWEGVNIHLISTAPISHGLIQDSLFIMEPDGTLSPNIADTYVISEDGKTITVTIPDDLQYYDGTYVKPEDMKRSIEWGHDVSAYGSDWDAITSVEVDGQDVIIHMEAGFNKTVEFYLGNMFWPIVCAEDIDTKSEEELIWGTRVYGPYYVEEYVAGDHVTLKANPYYKTRNTHVENKGPMQVETVTVRFMTDQFAIVQGMLAGEIDITSMIRAESFAELESGGNLVIAAEPSDGVVNLLLNNDFELFTDERVRQAIMYLINREQIQEFSDSTLVARYGYLPTMSNGFDPALEEWYKENFTNKPDEARQLLVDAGWTDTNSDGFLDKDGQIFEFTVVDYRDNAVVRELLQIQLQEYGIKMNIEVVEFPAWKQQVQKDDTYEAAITSFYWPDAASSLPYIVRDPNLFPEDTDYFDLAASIASFKDPAEHTARATEVQRMLMETGYYFPLVQPNRIVVFSEEIYENVYYNYAMWRMWFSDIR